MGSYNLNGGLLSLSGLTQGSGSASFDISGGTIQATLDCVIRMPLVLSTDGGIGVFDSDRGYLTCSEPISGPGGLQKVGSGSLYLSGANSYTGPTTVNQGWLSVAGSLVSAVTVNRGGILADEGALTSVTVNPGGQLSSDYPVGVLSLSGSLILRPAPCWTTNSSAGWAAVYFCRPISSFSTVKICPI